MEKLEPLFKFYLGGHLGDGRHWLPWISLEDMTRVLQQSTEPDCAWSGAFLACGPNPVRMDELCRSLARQMGTWSWLHVPYFAVRLAVGQAAPYAVSSQNIRPTRLVDDWGFEHRHKTIDECFAALYPRE